MAREQALRGLLDTGLQEMGGSGTNTQVCLNQSPGLAHPPPSPPSSTGVPFPTFTISVWLRGWRRGRAEPPTPSHGLVEPTQRLTAGAGGTLMLLTRTRKAQGAFCAQAGFAHVLL